MKTYQSAVKITLDQISLEGQLSLPKVSTGLVIFAHGSGSGRFSPRNNFVAEKLQQAGLGTLLFDLLTPQEDMVYENRFNISLITDRLIGATHWLTNQPAASGLSLGYFGASTGSAAALEAAAQLDVIKAIVSRGGRPDLAKPKTLAQITIPTLLIVGGNDEAVISLNQQALQLMKAEKELKIIPEATHLFEEPGTLEAVASLAAAWFKKYLE